MKKTKKNKNIAIILVVILLLGIIAFVISKNIIERKTIKLSIENYIDMNDEYYANKTAYEKDGDIIIEGEENSKTIITTKTKKETGLKEATAEIQKQYTISDIKTEFKENKTEVSGKVKNNTKSKHKVIIQTKFYNSEGKVVGTLNYKIDKIKPGETQTFNNTIMGDFTKYKNETKIEYTN